MTIKNLWTHRDAGEPEVKGMSGWHSSATQFAISRSESCDHGICFLLKSPEALKLKVPLNCASNMTQCRSRSYTRWGRNREAAGPVKAEQKQTTRGSFSISSPSCRCSAGRWQGPQTPSGARATGRAWRSEKESEPGSRRGCGAHCSPDRGPSPPRDRAARDRFGFLSEGAPSRHETRGLAGSSRRSSPVWGPWRSQRPWWTRAEESWTVESKLFSIKFSLMQKKKTI